MQIDIFAGAGGLTYGFHQAGYRTGLAIDHDKSAIETLRRNNPTVGLVEDLTVMEPSDAPVAAEQVTGVIGGPPCQDFSVANYYSRGGERTNLVFVFADWVAHFDPDYFVMENVVGIKSTGNVFDRLLNTFPDDYAIEHKTLNAADYGAPQDRSRVFIAGCKHGGFTFPSATGTSETCGEALSGLPRVAAGEHDESVANHRAPNHQQKTIDRIASAEHGEPLFEKWSERVRLDPSQPAPTLKAGKRINYHFGHPEIPRGLTVRERARLQTFPDDYVFSGTLTEQRTQTGNAVPPAVARAIAEQLKDCTPS